MPIRGRNQSLLTVRCPRPPGKEAKKPGKESRWQSMHKDDVTESFIAQPEARNKAQILCKDPFQGWKTRNAKVMPSWEKTGRSSQSSTTKMTNGDLAAILSREPRLHRGLDSAERGKSDVVRAFCSAESNGLPGLVTLGHIHFSP